MNVTSNLEAVVGQFNELHLGSNNQLLARGKRAFEEHQYEVAYTAFRQVIDQPYDRVAHGEAYFHLYTLMHAKLVTPVYAYDLESLAHGYLTKAVECGNPEAALEYAELENPSKYLSFIGPEEYKKLREKIKGLYEIAIRDGSGNTKFKAMFLSARMFRHVDDSHTTAESYYKELADGDSSFRQQAADEYSKICAVDEKVKYILRSALQQLELYLLQPDMRAKVEKALKLSPKEKGYDVLLLEPYYKAMLRQCLAQQIPGATKGIHHTPALLTFLDLYDFPLRGIEQAEFMAQRIDELKRIYKKRR